MAASLEGLDKFHITVNFSEAAPSLDVIPFLKILADGNISEYAQKLMSECQKIKAG